MCVPTNVDVLIELRKKYLCHKWGGDDGVKVGTNSRLPSDYRLPSYYMKTGFPKIEALLDPNPLAVSSVRPNGLNSWDQAYWLPDQRNRLLAVRDVKSVCPLNRKWREFTLPVLRMTRGIIGEGEIDRGIDDFIDDFRDDGRMGDVWFLQEAAHVLAHMRAGDSCRDMPHVQAEFGGKNELGPYASHNLQALAELLMSQRYKLGIDLRGRDKLGLRQASMSHGVEVVPTLYLGTSKLLVEHCAFPGLRYDGVGAIVLMGFALSPPPISFKTGSQYDGPLDGFAGRPMLAAYIGWCTPDMLFHGEVASLFPESPSARCFNVLDAHDLLPMDTFPAYLQLASESTLFTSSEQEFIRADTWMHSQGYGEAFLQTPPWPCGECMLIDSRERSMPDRPSHSPKTVQKFKSDPDWQSYRQAKRRLIQSATKAVKHLESKIYKTPKDALSLRKRREEGNKERLDKLANQRIEAEILQRRRMGKDLTKKQTQYLREQSR